MAWHAAVSLRHSERESIHIIDFYLKARSFSGIPVSAPLHSAPSPSQQAVPKHNNDLYRRDGTANTRLSFDLSCCLLLHYSIQTALRTAGKIESKRCMNTPAEQMLADVLPPLRDDA